MTIDGAAAENPLASHSLITTAVPAGLVSAEPLISHLVPWLMTTACMVGHRHRF